VMIYMSSSAPEEKPRIRLRYSSLINFSARVYSAFTGMLFIMLITRNLAPTDVGLWRLINILLVYFIIPATTFNRWIVRYRARGFKNSSLTGLMNAILLSSVMVPIFLLVSVTTITELRDNISLILLAAILLVLLYILQAFLAMARALAPQSLGIGMFIFETFKVIIALVYAFSHMINLITAMISMIMAYVLQLLYILSVVYHDVRGSSFSLDLLKRWYKLSWLQAYDLLAKRISSLDNFIIYTMCQSPGLALAYLQVLLSASGPVFYTVAITSPFYSKALWSGVKDEIRRSLEVTLRLIFMMSLPSLFGLIAISPLILALFGKEYIGLQSLLALAVMAPLVNILSLAFDSCILSIERADVETTDPRVLVRSYLFKVSTIHLLQGLVYVVIVFLFAFIRRPGPLEIVLALFIARVIIFITAMLVRLRIAARLIGGISLSTLLRNMYTYLIASLIMLLVVRTSFMMYNIEISALESMRISEVLLLLAPLVMIGIVTYSSIIYLIDREARRIGDYIIWKVLLPTMAHALCRIRR